MPALIPFDADASDDASASDTALETGSVVPARQLVARAVLWGLVAAVVGAALPPSARAAIQGKSAALLGVTVWGVFVVPSVASVLGLSLARQACEEVVRLRRIRRNGPMLVAFSLGLTAFFPVTFFVGTVLYRTTHHRGLGGATFGFLALLIGAASALLAVRVAAWIERARTRHAQLGGALGAAAMGCGLLVAVIAAGRGLAAAGMVWSSLSGSVQVGAVDATVWAFCLVVGGLTRRPEKVAPRLGRALVPVACLLAAAGIAVVLGSPAAAESITTDAPFAAFIAQAAGIM